MSPPVEQATSPLLHEAPSTALMHPPSPPPPPSLPPSPLVVDEVPHPKAPNARKRTSVRMAAAAATSVPRANL